MEPTPELLAVLFAMGLVVGLLAYGEHRHRERLRTTGGQASAVVVRNKFHLGRTSVFRPVVRFTTAAGAVIEAEYEHGVALAIPRYRKGSAVRVAYDPANPLDFVILTPPTIM